jgi:prepilin-type N-terminal cleavage/methylation domain-containing protein
MIKYKNGCRAFTLVELLVVISIIALLLGVLVPATNKARNYAKKVVCRTSLYNCGLAVRMYLDDNKQYMPPAAQMPSVNVTKRPIADYLASYIGDKKALKCPGDKQQKFFLQEGSSYEYNMSLGDQRVEKTFLAERHGVSQVNVLNDYESFHGKKGVVGSVNYLYADSYIGDRSRK